MKLGILGLMSRELADVSPAAIRRVREMGFTGTGFPQNDPSSSISTERAREVGQMFHDEGVDLIEYGRYQTSLIHPDAEVRRENIAGLREAFRVAKAAGCPAVFTGAGGFNPKSHWFPHPENHSLAVLDRLLASLREAVKAAEDAGVILGLECHVNNALKDAETTRQVIDAVGSPALQCHLDPVNWLRWETVFHSGKAAQDMIAALGHERIFGAHSKGIAVEDRLVTHLNEVFTSADGDIFDHATFLKEIDKMPPGTYFAIEHITVENIPRARDHINRVAEQIGVRFER